MDCSYTAGGVEIIVLERVVTAKRVVIGSRHGALPFGIRRTDTEKTVARKLQIASQASASRKLDGDVSMLSYDATTVAGYCTPCSLTVSFRRGKIVEIIVQGPASA